MSSLIKIQNFILESSPALFPMLALFYSLFTSLHCSVMCGPFLPSPIERNKYFIFRLVSYSIMGGIFGLFGDVFRKSVEYELFSILAFVVFGLTTLSIAGLQIIPKKILGRFRILDRERGGVFRGLLSAFIPCHSLFFFYSLAVMTQSIVGGWLILFAHGVATTPSLHFGRQIVERLVNQFKYGQKVIYVLILVLSLLNLSYFASRIFHSDEHAKSKILFCL